MCINGKGFFFFFCKLRYSTVLRKDIVCSFCSWNFALHEGLSDAQGP